MIRVALVDDDPLVRAGLTVILGAEPDLDVVGEAGDGADVQALVARCRPDVVLMDVRMPGVDGIEATRALAARPAAPAVVVITTFEHDSHVADALRAGARGFVLKRAPVDQLVTAVRVAATTDAVLFPASIRDLVARADAPVPAWVGRLTGREHDVLDLVARGRTNAEIGATLFVGAETVKTHVGSLLAKSGARDRTALAIAAHECGLLRPDHREAPS
ncbi:response regulator [Agilicoccus flavus]|uniref:response regulator n=1 Tax=Agilicoccus flavus TaxID=2775968 RepID=UPI001CF6D910|nr:response regulator transcription factor [Agilicoccus flavus]